MDTRDGIAYERSYILQKTKTKSTVKLNIDSKKHRKFASPKGGQIANALKIVGCVVGGAMGVCGLIYLDRKGYLPMPSEEDVPSEE